MRTKLQIIGTILFVLSAAVLGTIYLAWLVYPLEISFLGLEKAVYMKAADISYNFNILMNYLTNPFASVLDMPNFSSSADGLKHFADVKHLFHLTQRIFILTLPAFVLFVKNILLKGYGDLVKKVIFWTMLTPMIIGLLGVLVGFDQFFVLFHTVLFPGDSTWLFDPAKDPVIYILPQEFFLHCFVLFFVLYEFFFGIILAWTGKKNRIG
ncbi:TPA: TIGR01906 family membrane protein [Streptococcus suis]|uniref:TIGR01906 family membrane protein n=2 Tax=Streptococcus suis TaxID=1307 RepID=UPI00040E91F5|nr:TIGR01906 family membrane protein [Streptococcus suis]HEL1669100.1 TIGR01906 family membrane protein [Streptococcus suis]HEL1754363.1 TIGR01906 family membrane protein [Streptococcus suis]HEM3221353.1 TIGR01906 family membrane protein [Streptococcus suis 2651]HEM4744351.1 TIGR01906 family membrane protein [Streptococcus suis]HEM4824232.1 TIGR01906 family membrane protein [Streptococcus suis]